jgi:hypothetical protein
MLVCDVALHDIAARPGAALADYAAERRAIVAHLLDMTFASRLAELSAKSSKFDCQVPLQEGEVVGLVRGRRHVFCFKQHELRYLRVCSAGAPYLN